MRVLAPISMTPDGEYSCTCEPGGGIRLWQRDGHFVRDDRVLLPGVRIRALSMGLDASYSEGIDPVYILCLTEYPIGLKLYRLTDTEWVQQSLPRELDVYFKYPDQVKSIALSSQVFGALLMIKPDPLKNAVLHLDTQGYRSNNSYPTTQFIKVRDGFTCDFEPIGLALTTYPPAADDRPPIKYEGLQAAVISFDGVEFYDYRLVSEANKSKYMGTRTRTWFRSQHFIPLPEGGDGAPVFSPDGNHLFVKPRDGRGVLHFQRDTVSGNLQWSAHVARDLPGVLGVAACEYNDRIQIRIATETSFKLFERDEAGNWSELS